eukprot:g42292.t1
MLAADEHVPLSSRACGSGSEVILPVLGADSSSSKVVLPGIRAGSKAPPAIGDGGADSSGLFKMAAAGKTTSATKPGNVARWQPGLAVEAELLAAGRVWLQQHQL